MGIDEGCCKPIGFQMATPRLRVYSRYDWQQAMLGTFPDSE